jgi:hypothetical protein
MTKNTIFLWTALIILTIIRMATQDIALFLQTTKFLSSASIYEKLISNQFWATVMWIIAIPSVRIGYELMGAILSSMVGIFFLFMGQLVTNYILNIKSTIDDYLAIIVIIIGLTISNYQFFG